MSVPSLHPATRRVFAAVDLCREITVLRPELDLEVGRSEVPGRPGLVALDPEERMLLLPLPGDGIVLVINAARVHEHARFHVGPTPVAVVVP